MGDCIRFVGVGVLHCTHLLHGRGCGLDRPLWEPGAGLSQGTRRWGPYKTPFFPHLLVPNGRTSTLISQGGRKAIHTPPLKSGQPTQWIQSRRDGFPPTRPVQKGYCLDRKTRL